eukprot:IDg6755t1
MLRKLIPSAKLLMHSDAIDKLTPNAHQNRDINSLLVRVKDLKSVTKTLQSHSTRHADVRSLLDAVFDSYPETCARLIILATIINSSGAHWHRLQLNET